MVTKGHTYLKNPLSMYDLLLLPGIKGLSNFSKKAQTYKKFPSCVRYTAFPLTVRSSFFKLVYCVILYRNRGIDNYVELNPYE